MEHSEADPNIQSRGGHTVLRIAALDNHVEVVRLLMEHSEADPNIRNNCGDTVLRIAACRHNIEVVRLLMENRKADRNIRNNDGDTMLYDAVCNTSSSDDSFDIVQMLIEHGADVKAITKEGFTVSPLHETCRISKKISVDLARVLLENGANVNTKSIWGHSALQNSMSKGVLHLMDHNLCNSCWSVELIFMAHVEAGLLPTKLLLMFVVLMSQESWNAWNSWCQPQGEGPKWHASTVSVFAKRQKIIALFFEEGEDDATGLIYVLFCAMLGDGPLRLPENLATRDAGWRMSWPEPTVGACVCVCMAVHQNDLLLLCCMCLSPSRDITVFG